jgi:hypothetical protein
MIICLGKVFNMKDEPERYKTGRVEQGWRELIFSVVEFFLWCDETFFGVLRYML